MANYKLNQMAKADLREIYRYGLFEHGENRADLYYADFFVCFDQIGENPYLLPCR